MDGFFAIVGLAGAMLMRLGFTVHGGGMVRAKNAASMTMRCLCDLCLSVLAFWALGMAIAGAPNGILGLEFRLLLGWDILSAEMPIFGIGAVVISAAIVSGVLAERSRFWPALWSSVLLAGLVVPIAMLWTSGGGWLKRIGFMDAGGAASLHWTGALCALVGAVFVGPREGKYHRDGSATAIPGHSVPMAGMGAMLLLIGWTMFVGAGAGARAAVNLVVGAAAGGVAALILSELRYYKPDVHLTIAGILGAMVAVSAPGGSTNMLGAVIVGSVAGVVVPMAILVLDINLRIDDPTGGVTIHGIGAAWGVLSVPLVARSMGFVERLKVFGAQVLGLAAIGVVVVGLSVVLWMVLKRTTKLTVGEAAEFDGLDLAEHDIAAYPDFQQSMIKSYDLRQL